MNFVNYSVDLRLLTCISNWIQYFSGTRDFLCCKMPSENYSINNFLRPAFCEGPVKWKQSQCVLAVSCIHVHESEIATQLRFISAQHGLTCIPTKVRTAIQVIYVIFLFLRNTDRWKLIKSNITDNNANYFVDAFPPLANIVRITESITSFSLGPSFHRTQIRNSKNVHVYFMCRRMSFCDSFYDAAIT
jgi:hypothetical protein